MLNNKGERIAIEERTEAYKAFIPWLTFSVLGICVMLYLALNFVEPSWGAYNYLGLYSIMDLRAGDYWALITNNFMHLEWWHLLLNMYWLLVFGKQIEYRSGRYNMILLMLVTAIGASALQVFVTDDMGMGFSGIGYGMFGFIWASSKYFPQVGYSISKKEVNLFVYWFFICIILTKLDVLQVGNAGHLGGFIAGWGLAWVVFKRTTVNSAVYAVLMLLVLVPSIWAPWSMSAMNHCAYKLHEQQRLEEALVIYDKILEREPGNQFAKTNKNTIIVYQLAQAYQIALALTKIEEADSLLNEILVIDPIEPWANQQKNVIESFKNIQYQIIPDEE